MASNHSPIGALQSQLAEAMVQAASSIITVDLLDELDRSIMADALEDAGWAAASRLRGSTEWWLAWVPGFYATHLVTFKAAALAEMAKASWQAFVEEATGAGHACPGIGEPKSLALCTGASEAVMAANPSVSSFQALWGVQNDDLPLWKTLGQAARDQFSRSMDAAGRRWGHGPCWSWLFGTADVALAAYRDAVKAAGRK